MSNREKIEKVIIYIVFALFILLMIKILFLSRVSFFELFDGEREVERSFNLIPFQSVIEFLLGNTENSRNFSYANLVGNIAIFIPLGFYISFFRKESRKDNILVKSILTVFVVSLAVEIVQWLFVIGTADIDDIILNCIGGFVGILVFKMLIHIIKNERIVHTIIAIVSIIGLPVIYYYLFIIIMRF